jgi:hypothetical protein
MKSVTITPDQLYIYATLTKNEVLLHIALKSLSTDGKLKRNINQIGRLLKKTKQRLRDAEAGLKRVGLLRVRMISGKRYWYVYNEPVLGLPHSSDEVASVGEALPKGSAEPPKRPGLLKRFSHWLTGTQVGSFDLEVR